MCEAAIGGAEADQKLPARVLSAIALRESGRRDPETGRARPWPWTINYEGTGHFYASKAEAIAAVQDIQATGGQSVDVGCMQVNLLHHPNAFSNLDEAFDPTRNASYAGRFLKALFGSLGDWGTAIGAYHSRTPGKGEAYRDQVVATWNPKDPAVLAKLSLLPMAPITGTIPGLPLIYAPFAKSGPIQIGPNMAYRSFMPAINNYRSFAPAALVYADFARKAGKQRGRPLDLRMGSGLASSGRALIVPNGMIERPGLRPPTVRSAMKRSKENG